MSEAPAGWLRAVDESLVAAHLGTAEGSDDYDTAKRKLNALIDWHVAVATDPAVNGGWQLVPVSEPTEAQIEARDALLDFISENGTASEGVQHYLDRYVCAALAAKEQPK